jgi:hypothetical protein
MQKKFRQALLTLAAVILASPGFAQAPNTAALAVIVTDQTGGVVPGATVTVNNMDTGATRTVTSTADGSALVPALPVTGRYTVRVTRTGFTAEPVSNLELRAGDTATVRVRLVASGGQTDVTVIGGATGVRTDPQIGRRLDQGTIEELPILGRKVTSLPLYNSAFRQGKGTGDLFVNATYFITGGGSRRTTSFTLDGASNDEGWGRQTMITTVPVGAIEEMQVLSNAFSAEYGWTAGPAVNIVTRSGTNATRGDALYMARPGGWQATSFGTSNFCPSSIGSCETPSTLQSISPADVPDVLHQFSGSFSAPLVRDHTFLFVAADRTHQDRTTYLAESLPAFVLINGSREYEGRYRQTLGNARLDHRLADGHSLMLRGNVDRFYDTNPNDAVAGTNAPTVARRYSRQSWSTQANLTSVLTPTVVNEARVAYLHGDPVTKWEAQQLSTTYSRSGSAPFTIGQSRQSDLYGHQFQVADTLTWAHGRHALRVGASVSRHTSGGFGNEPGFATLGTFTFLSSTTAPFDQLTLADVQRYSQPVSYGVTEYEVSQWLLAAYAQDVFRVSNDLTLNLGLRYDVQTLTDARNNIAPRVGFSWHPGGDARMVVRGGYGMYYTQIRTNAIANALTGGLDGFTSYTAVPGQTGFPTCLTGACLPVQIDPRTLPLSQQPARDITILAGEAARYRAQFADYGLDFDRLTAYPDALVNPRSQVLSFGAEREVTQGLFVGADYVYQHWTDLDRTIDLNAPAAFDRTAPGQTRSVAAANATRPIVPVNGGVRRVNVLTNMGVADYHGLQTELSYRGHPRLFAAISYTLSKATNTTEPDGNGVGPNQAALARLGEEERGPSVVDQRHRAVVTLTYQLPHDITVGTVTQLASARPISAVTGVDNDGDGNNTDRPVINGQVMEKSAFRGTGTQDVSAFGEVRVHGPGRTEVRLRIEGFNLFNHANILGRSQQTWGDAATANATFGQVASAGSSSQAIPSLANIDPPRMFQLQVRFVF